MKRISLIRSLLFLILVLSISLFMLGCQPEALPPDDPDVPEEKPLSISVDGEKQTLLTEPYIKDERMLLSLADIESMLDIDFEYDSTLGVVTAATEDYSVTLTLDSNTADGSRRNYTLVLAPTLIDGTVMLPVDFVAEQLGFSISYDEGSNTVLIEKLVLIRDEPESDAQRWILQRARQLTEFTFVPVNDIPTKFLGGTEGVFEAGKEYRGIPYSSTEYNDKFICENVSFETFLSALANPDSVLYTKNLYHTSNASTYYGMVCNGFVRYCLGITHRCNTGKWMQIPGMLITGFKGSYDANDLELCDILHSNSGGINHVAMITGILRDEDGNVVKVEVSDQTLPTTRRRINSLEDFEYWSTNYTLVRYCNMRLVPPFDEEQDDILYDSGIENISPMIAVDYGNKSNYMAGDTTVISSFAEGDNVVQIFRDDVLVEEIAVSGYEKIERVLDRGYYIVKLKGTDYYNEFCVCQPEITYKVEGNVITVYASSGDSESQIAHFEFRQKGTKVAGLEKMITLTDEEKESGIIVEELTKNSHTFKVTFQNKYGMWTHKIIKIDRNTNQE